MAKPDDIIYFDYPEYVGSGNSGYPGAEIAKQVGVPNKLNVGHNAMMLVKNNPNDPNDPTNGQTEFYEYGRYNQKDLNAGDRIVGTYKPGKGNWVRRRVADVSQKNKDGSLDYESYLKRTAIPYGKGHVNATVITDTNNNAARAYITGVGSSKYRIPYNLLNTCATQAQIATQIGRYTGASAYKHDANPINWIADPIKGTVNNVRNMFLSKGWGLLPGTSQRTGAQMSQYGTTYWLNK